MTTRPHSSFKIVFILGLLAMLMPLSIDMYLPALPVISRAVWRTGRQRNDAQHLHSWFCAQLFYGPMETAWGANRYSGQDVDVAAAAVACALAQSIDQTDRDAFLPWPGCGCGKRGD